MRLWRRECLYFKPNTKHILMIKVFLMTGQFYLNRGYNIYATRKVSINFTPETNSGNLCKIIILFHGLNLL